MFEPRIKILTPGVCRSAHSGRERELTLSARKQFLNGLLVAAVSLVPACRVGTQAPVGEPRWVEPPTGPATARHGHRVHAIRDLVVLVGGQPREATNGEWPTTECWIFDADVGAWSRGPDLAHEHTFFGSVTIEDTIHALGDVTESWSPGESAWRETPVDPPFPTSHFAATAAGGLVFTVGGFPEDRAGARLHDLERNVSVPVDDLPGFEPGDHFHIAVTLEDHVHVVGGLSDSGPSKSHWRLERGRWVARAAPPFPVWAKFTAYGVVANQLYLFEAENAAAYDPASDSWRRVTPMPRDPDAEWPAAMPASCEFDGRLLVTGGFGAPRESSVRLYDPVRDAWHIGPDGSAVVPSASNSP